MRDDLVIRGGELADGDGGPLPQADMAVDGGRITAAGRPTGALPGRWVRRLQAAAG